MRTRTLIVVLPALLMAVCSSGCRQPTDTGMTPPEDPARVDELGPDAGIGVVEATPEPGDEPEDDDPQVLRSDPGKLPPCGAEVLGDGSSEATVTGYSDLDGDGIIECIMGFQGTETDELGEPIDTAYFQLARWTGAEWEEWFGIPAPGGEKYVDMESIVIAHDINDDGVVELGLQFYGFGVSSRPETFYLWQVGPDGLEEAIEGSCVGTSSDDGLVVQDLVPSYTGEELIFAIAEMGDEAHADAHGYSIHVYAWHRGLYREVDQLIADGVFATPFEAIERHAEEICEAVE